MKTKPLILVALLLAALLINLETTMVNVALPTLVRELHASDSQLQWIVDIYNLVFAALLLTAGSLSDRLGRKEMLLAGLAVFGAASIAGGLTSNVSALIVARAFMGLGAAMTFPPTLSLITNVFTERKERAQAIGLWGATIGVAVATGPIVGGFLLAHFSWSSVFYAMGPVAAVAFLFVALSVPDSRDPVDGRIDFPGLVLSGAGMGLIVYTLIEAPTYGWTAGRSIAGYLAFALLLGVFVVWERRVKHPMLDVEIFRNMRFSAASASVAIAFFGLFGFSFLIVQYFQFIHAWSPLNTGVHLLPIAFAVGIGSVVGMQLAVKVGTKIIVTGGLLMVTAFYVWIALANGPTTSYAEIAAQMVLGGIGMGFTTAPATESVMGAVSRAQAGVGSAVNDSTPWSGERSESRSSAASSPPSTEPAFTTTSPPSQRQSVRPPAAQSAARCKSAAGSPKPGTPSSPPTFTASRRTPSSTAFTPGASSPRASPPAGCSSRRASCPHNRSSSPSISMSLTTSSHWRRAWISPPDDGTTAVPASDPAQRRTPASAARPARSPAGRVPASPCKWPSAQIPNCISTTQNEGVSTMFELTDLIERNKAFAANRPEAGPLPRQPLFLLTCIDPRTDPAAFLGLLPGDAPVMRNAGGRVTDSVIADVAFIGQLAGAMGADPEGPLFEVVIIHHTQCGTGFLADEGFRHTLVKATGYDDAELAAQAVTDAEATVRADVAKLRAAKQVNPRVRVSGHVYDLDTGLVTTVVPA